MRILFENIISFLKENQVKYELHGELHSDYKISSIFFPEKNGFYFMENEVKIEQFNNSLFLANHKEIIKNFNGNGVIKIGERPQVIFYKLLNYYFKEKSNGKISNLSSIHPEAVIGKNVQIDAFVVVGKCKIEDEVIIKSNSVIEDKSTLQVNVIIESNCTIGATGIAWVWDKNGERITQPQLGGVLIKKDCIIGANSVIVRGSLNENTMLGNNAVIAPGAKIGHGCVLEDNVHLANNVSLAGNVKVGQNTFVGSGAVISPKIEIPRNTIIGAGAMVNKNFVKENCTLVGVPAKVLYEDNSLNAGKGVPVQKNKKNEK
ncbi:hypothetical protein LZ575_08560 [Antarcticibacterium sp. 1MA-6-2]|uniref:DapH/DapD/GlmU-related protein n=1 Tax=Antarcticibacterium sp. 1MA-6-2 TaxID=2908210 RepID=UPI001F36C9AC|nr:DapH/DapD/GlmU-related protein [Antarcticibacterium sp. 1MA-6-2]UJH92524.1 hypothetical protein LZ575_08560 [Antarcticibacterium sp. 1MA-6-2]